jgi:hypothetical protein
MPLTGFQGVRVGSHTTNASLSSAVTITIPEGVDSFLLQAFTQNVRVTFDGTTPTSTTGFQLTAGSLLQVDVGLDSTVKIIQETASASIQYQFFRTRRDYDV